MITNGLTQLYINASGNIGIGTVNNLSYKLNVNGTTNVSGTFSAPGIMRLLDNTIDTTQDTINSNTTVNIFSKTVTLSGSSSRIYVNFDADYSISGSRSDTWKIYLYIGSTSVFNKSHIFSWAEGGGTRSSVLAPLIYMSEGSYSGNQTITIFIQRSSSDDTMYVYQKNIMIFEVYT